MSSPNHRRDAAVGAVHRTLVVVAPLIILSSFAAAARRPGGWSGFGLVGLIVIALGVQSLVIYRTRADRVPASTEAGPTRPRLGLKGLIALVAVCAILLYMARPLWDLLPGNAPTRGLRDLRSSDPATRARGALELGIVLTHNRPATTTEQAGALVDALPVALHDDHASVREEATRAILTFAFESVQRSRAFPRLQAVVAGLAERLGDDAPAVRWHAALALADIYPPLSETNPLPPPPDPAPLVAALRRALGDPDPQVRGWASQVLGTITPRLGRSPPPAPASAPGPKDPEARAQAEVAPRRSRPPEGAQPCRR
jgi:hypothetical protein